MESLTENEPLSKKAQKAAESFLKTLSSIFTKEGKQEKSEPKSSYFQQIRNEKPVENQPKLIEQIDEEQKIKEKQRQDEMLKKSRELLKSIRKINTQTIPGTTYEFEKRSDLGKGGFGQVYEVFFPEYKSLSLQPINYALKIIRYNPEKNKESFIQKNLNEKYIMDRIQKETGCLPEFLCYYFPNNEPIIDSKNNIWYISELMDGDIRKLFSIFDLEERIDFVNENLYPSVKSGIEKLHEMGLIHADIKPENLLYKKDQDKNNIIVKIGDLGGSCTLLFDETGKSTDPKCSSCKICKNNFKGSLPYVLPSIFEQYIEQVYDKKYNSLVLWNKQTDDYAFALSMLNFIIGKNIISSTYLQSILKDAASNKILESDLVLEYKNYLIQQFEVLPTNKATLLNLGLKPEIYNFILEQINHSKFV